MKMSNFYILFMFAAKFQWNVRRKRAGAVYQNPHPE